MNFGTHITRRNTRRLYALHRAVRDARRFVHSRYRLLPARNVTVLKRPIGGAMKRVVDVFIAAGALVTLFPLFGLVACLVKVYDGGPILYRHTRLGHGRRTFPCLKFRTMVMNADMVLADHLRRSHAAAREWATTRKLKSDPRITPVGATLRKLSIDELPQLFNVLRGEMSIVGPRPIVSDEIQMYGEDIDYYFKARPGLTGAWQVSGRSNIESYARRVTLDRGYVENWSLWTDLQIVVKTIPVVLAARDAY
jgi:lipopolysaccharide/colanic/teichoic acid biosynthesis glycosyltransferase